MLQSFIDKPFSHIKMTSSQLWKSVSTYTSLFQTFSNFPFTFITNGLHTSTVVIIKEFKQLKFFWVSFLLTCCGTTSALILCVGRLLGVTMFQKLKLWKLVFAGEFVAVGFFMISINLAFVLAGDMLAVGLERNLKFERTLEQCKKLRNIIT